MARSMPLAFSSLPAVLPFVSPSSQVSINRNHFGLVLASQKPTHLHQRASDIIRLQNQRFFYDTITDPQSPLTFLIVLDNCLVFGQVPKPPTDGPSCFSPMACRRSRSRSFRRKALRQNGPPRSHASRVLRTEEEVKTIEDH